MAAAFHQLECILHFFESEGPVDDGMQAVKCNSGIHIGKYIARTDENALDTDAVHQNAENIGITTRCKYTNQTEVTAAFQRSDGLIESAGTPQLLGRL